MFLRFAWGKKASVAQEVAREKHCQEGARPSKRGAGEAALESQQQHGSGQAACGRVPHGRRGGRGTGEAAAVRKAGAIAPCQVAGARSRRPGRPRARGAQHPQGQRRRCGAAPGRSGATGARPEERPPGPAARPRAAATSAPSLCRRRGGGSRPRPSRADLPRWAPPPGQARPGQARPRPHRRRRRGRPGPARPSARPPRPGEGRARPRNAASPFATPPLPSLPFPLYLPRRGGGNSPCSAAQRCPGAAEEGRGGRADGREGGALSPAACGSGGGRGLFPPLPAQVVQPGLARLGSRCRPRARCPVGAPPRRQASGAAPGPAAHVTALLTAGGGAGCCAGAGPSRAGGGCGRGVVGCVWGVRGVPCRLRPLPGQTCRSGWDITALTASCRARPCQGPASGAGLRGAPAGVPGTLAGVGGRNGEKRLDGGLDSGCAGWAGPCA